jgi:hypothetical protein
MEIEGKRTPGQLRHRGGEGERCLESFMNFYFYDACVRDRPLCAVRKVSASDPDASMHA